MARDPKRLRKAYEFKIGKDRADKLSDEQINLLSKYYNSLSESEQRDIDAKVFQGRSNELFEMADAFASESQGSVATAPAEPPPPPKPGGALAIYSGKAETGLVDEEIDERILRLLGLEEVFDIDYATYLSLLKEKMAAARMSDSTIPTEEVELLTEEFKQVKRKTGRFKVKKKKINTSTFFNEASQAATVKPIRALPPAVEEGVEEQEEEQEEEEEKVNEIAEFIEKVLEPSLTKIEKNLESILETLTKQANLEKKEAEAENKARQKEKRRAREAVLEGQSGADQVKKTAESISKPAMSIFDFIKDFVLNTLMGGAFGWLLDFLADPAGTWDRTWKNLVNGIIGLLNDVIKFLYDNLIMPINRFLHDMNLSIEDMEKQINSALALFGQKGITLPRIPLIPLAQIQPIPLAGQPPNTGGPIIFTAPQMAGGGMVDGNTGGRISGMGVDTQLVALSPGEVVMSNKAGDMYGRDTLLGMNAAAGGTNRPKMGKGVLGFQGGGQVYDIRRATSRDVGTPTMGTAPKGILIVPGHYGYGGGTPGSTSGLSRQAGMAPGWDEYLANVRIGREVVRQVQSLNSAIPIRFYEKPGGFEYSNAGLADAIAHYKDLERQGYEVIELHHDEPKGRGGLLGSYTNYSSLDKRLAELGGNFGYGYKGRFVRSGYGMNKAGISMFEVAPLGGKYEQGLISGDPNAAISGAAPLVQAITEVYGGNRQSPTPQIPSVQVSPLPSGNRTEVHVSPPVVTPSVTVLPVPVGGNSNGQTMSGSAANQKQLPAFSSTDANNFEMMVVKSIYNIVG